MYHSGSAHRPRRLRTTSAMRSLVAETRLDPAEFILPMFYGVETPKEIATMPGVYQHNDASLLKAAEEALAAGVRCVDLFGLPAHKDAEGSEAWDPNGALNRGIRLLRQEFGDELVIMADTCLDEFTSHGHCGVLDEQGRVKNDETLELYARMAVSQAEAGVHMVSPSGMMDNQIAVIRGALDQAGFQDVAIMAYSAKYASAFYGPFRDAVESSLDGDRRTYQQDPANFTESLREVDLDIAQGADIVMVKPAMAYLDVIREVSQNSPVPVAAYQVSGEYTMLMTATWADRQALMMEALTSIKRAGANMILTYYATEAAKLLRRG